MRPRTLSLALLTALACNDGGDKDDTDPVDTEDGADTDEDGADTDEDGTDTDDDGTDPDDTDDGSDTDTADTAAPAGDVFLRVYGLDLEGEVDVSLDGYTVDPSWAGLDSRELSTGPASGYITVPSGVTLDVELEAEGFDDLRDEAGSTVCQVYAPTGSALAAGSCDVDHATTPASGLRQASLFTPSAVTGSFIQTERPDEAYWLFVYDGAGGAFFTATYDSTGAVSP